MTKIFKYVSGIFPLKLDGDFIKKSFINYIIFGVCSADHFLSPIFFSVFLDFREFFLRSQRTKMFEKETFIYKAAKLWNKLLQSYFKITFLGLFRNGIEEIF